MRWLDNLQMRLRMLVHRGRESARLDAELQDHLDRQIAENRAAGMSPEEARQAALRSFGNPALLREQTRDSWRWNALESFGRDLRIGTRTLLRSPGFASMAILVMALGIGANVALFTLVRSVLLRPLPFERPNRLVGIFEAQIRRQLSGQRCCRRLLRRVEGQFPQLLRPRHPRRSRVQPRRRRQSAAGSHSRRARLRQPLPAARSAACIRPLLHRGGRPSRSQRHRRPHAGGSGSAATAAIRRSWATASSSTRSRIRSSAFFPPGSPGPIRKSSSGRPFITKGRRR